MVVLNACEQQNQITDGTVYQKEHTKTYYGNDFGKVAHSRQEIEKEVVSMPPIHEEKGTDEVTMSRLNPYHFENWKVYIAQCPKGELPTQEKIEKECKINSFAVPREVYTSLKIWQHTDFKQPQ